MRMSLYTRLTVLFDAQSGVPSLLSHYSAKYVRRGCDLHSHLNYLKAENLFKGPWFSS